MVKVPIILLLVALCGPSTEAAIFGSRVPAAQYFVNQSTGSDSNNGTSETTAFLTVGKLAEVLQCGQLGAIYGGGASQLKYREQFTGAICIGASKQALTGYGNFQPLLDASDIITAGNFSKTAGRTNIYQVDVTFNANGFARVWEDSVSLARVASLDLLDSTAARYFIATDPSAGTPATFTLYVHATGSGSPASNGKVYEYNRRSYGVFSQSGMVVSNLHTRRQLSNNGSFEVGPNAFLTSLTANDGTKHNLLIHGGTTIRYCTLTDSYYNGGGKIALVLNDSNPTGEDAWIESCTYTETLELTGEGFYGHTNVGGIFGTVTVKNCTTVGAAQSVSGFTSHRMVVLGGAFNSNVTAASTTNLIQDTTITGGKVSLGYPVSVTIDNVAITCDCNNGLIQVANSVAVTSLTVTDSDFSNLNEFDGGIYVGVGATLGTFRMTGNTFLATVSTNHLLGPGAANLPVASVIDGNTYHYPGFINYRGTAYNLSNAGHWTSWQGLGFDATGSRVTP